MKTLFAIILLLMGLAMIAGYYLEKTSVISQIQFKGNHFTSLDELQNSIHSPVGLHPDSVNFMQLIESVNKLPYIKHTAISKGATGNITITVTEREPLALLIRDSRQVYFDEDGVKLPVILEKTVDVPIVYGFPVNPVSDTLKGNEFENVRDFIQEASKSDIGWITISEIAWNDREGVVALSYENGVKLLFGEQNFDTKIRYWEEFYSKIIKTKGIDTFERVDLRFRNQIVTHEKQTGNLAIQ